MKQLKILLQELNACEEAIEWVGDMSIEQAVLSCPRGDWMLWIAQRVIVDIRLLATCSGHCANTVRHLMRDERSIKAVDAVISFGKGEISKEDLSVYAAAYAAAYAATYAATYGATYAATYAANAADAAYAAAAASYASNAAAASYAAAAASYAADAADAADAACYSVKKENRLKTADICREYIGQAIIDKVNEMIKQQP